MRSTMLVLVFLLALSAVTCLAIRRKAQPQPDSSTSELADFLPRA
jgi:hypothetical protein